MSVRTKIKVSSHDLKLGMYVCELDRPWLDTPFLLQGFELKSPQDIDQLKELCTFVFVDCVLSNPSVAALLRTLSSRQPVVQPQVKRVSRLATPAVKPEKKHHYSDSVQWREELPRANAIIRNLTKVYQDLISEGRNQSALDVTKIKKTVTPMVDSIIRNPDACIWIARIKTGGDYAYRHALGCSIWCVVLGRQLGLPRRDLNKLALGGLLFDVGKTKLNADILNQPRKLTDDEFNQVQKHVEWGLRDLRTSDPHFDEDILDMVAHHHERHDGSGYPKGLAGGEIPVFARIAAIADCYDAITNERPYATAVSPSEAIKILYDYRNVDFQAELVEEFIQAIGIYPAGTIVQLSTGETAVVVAESRTRRLHPKVMMMLDTSGNPVANSRAVDLTEYTDANGEQVNITKSLEPDAFELDIAAMGF